MQIRLFLFVAVIFLLASCGPHSFNNKAPHDALPQLIVQADATIKAAPDLLQLRLGIVTEDEDAGVALADNNERMRSLMEMLAALGVPPDELATGQFQIHPQWSVPPRPTPANWQRQIIAYRVNNDLDVETTRVELAGELLGLAQKAGANQIGGLRFGLADPEHHNQVAITTATRNAQRKAQTLAAVAGARLGSIISLTLNSPGAYAGSQPLRLERTLIAAEAVPVAAGRVDVNASVTVIYQLFSGAESGK